MDNLDKSIKALNSKNTYIRSLRFPNYRNLRPDSELRFDFPITILLGRNGTNKSSIIHALYGSPSGKTIADFWFETKLDAIPLEKNGRKQSVIHCYEDQNSGKIVECIKARAPRGKSDPDYWEPVKHSQVYGLSSGNTRISPVKLNVIHLDFRGELPAFDKYFNFPDQKHLSVLGRRAKVKGDLRRVYRKKDYLRHRSGLLKKEIDEKGIRLTKEELEILKYILERDYVSGKILKHSLFHGHDGWTIIFGTEHLENGYSDAFAGSGESSATILVHNILKAPANSLILLDEPETSLHPRAQQRMLEFIAQQSVRKSLQFVIATHSIHFARYLPQNALRVLTLEKDGTVTINTDLSADEALHEISTIPAGKTILVEDERAKHIVNSALTLESAHAAKDFNVLVREGGVSRIYPDIQAYANSKRNDIFIIFDGDQRPTLPIPTDAELPQDEKELKSLIDQLIAGNNTNGRKLNFVDEDDMKRYISFLRKYTYYLPEITPEQLVWNDDAAKELLCEDLPSEISQEKDFKNRLQLLADKRIGHNADSIFNYLLAKILSSENSTKDLLIDIIKNIRKVST
jgi:ABC-type multidrug transport system ATPase subunit